MYVMSYDPIYVQGLLSLYLVTWHCHIFVYIAFTCNGSYTVRNQQFCDKKLHRTVSGLFSLIIYNAHNI